MENKKSKYIEIIILLLLLAASVCFLSHIFSPENLNLPVAINEKDRYYESIIREPENTIDTLIIGNSEAVTLVDTPRFEKETGRSAYSVGKAGSSVADAYYTLRDITKMQDIKLVILETDMFADDNIDYSSNREELKRVFTAETEHLFPVFRYHSAWKILAGQNEGYPLNSERGYEERTDIVPYTGGEYMLPTEEVSYIPKLRVFYMNKIVKFCRKNDIDLLFVSAPSALLFNTKKHNAVSVYTEENNIPYLDLNSLNDEIGIDWTTDTMDGGDHVNENGTEKVTDYLIKCISEVISIK